MTVPSPGPHGGDAGAVAAALGLDLSTVIDLSASLNPFAPDVTVVARRHLDALVAYPDERDATRALAECIDVDPDRLVLTNGGAEAIALVARQVGSGSVVDPEFSLYRRHLPQVSPSAGRWRSNPSNPLGALASPAVTAVVWDEAFYPLATGTWTRGDTEAWRLGSLTKLWACAGLRLGFAIAPDERAAAALRSDQPRWAVNGLAAAVVPELLDATDLGGWHRAVRSLREELVRALTSLGLTVVPSAANWVLVEQVSGLRDRLARHGVVVRDCTSFGLTDTVRIALPRPDQLDRVVRSIDRSLR